LFTHVTELPAKTEFVILSRLPESEVSLDCCCNTVAESLLTLVFLMDNVELFDRLSADDTEGCDVGGEDVFLMLLDLVLVSDVNDFVGTFDAWEELDEVRTLLIILSVGCCCISTAALSVPTLFPATSLS
jgi:hypothetical protein